MRTLVVAGILLSLTVFAENSELNSSENSAGRVKAHLNIHDLPGPKIQISLILQNHYDKVIKVPTKRQGGSDQMVLRVIKDDCLELSNTWGAVRALKGNTAIEVKIPPDEIGEVDLGPGQYARVEPITIDLNWIKKNNITRLIYSYESNLLGESANDLWSGSVEVELDLTELLERRFPE